MLFLYYAEKRKIRPKNQVGKKCPCFTHQKLQAMVQKTDGDRIIPYLRMVFTPFCGVKNGRGFQQLIPNWLQIGSEKKLEKFRKYILAAWKPILMFRHGSDTGESYKTKGLQELYAFYRHMTILNTKTFQQREEGKRRKKKENIKRKLIKIAIGIGRQLYHIY